MQSEIQNPSTSRNLLDSDFPALESSSNAGCKSDLLTSVLPAYEPAKITEVIEIPFDQRKMNSEGDRSSGKRYASQNKICMDIVKETGVEINLTSSKSNTLTVVLSGTPERVAKAKRSIISEFQQQESAKVSVPREYHGYLIGRRGERLRELELATLTRIHIPTGNAQDGNTITVTGPKQGVADAVRAISDLVETQSQLAFERIDIPKIYHPFICGPNNKLINELRDCTETKIGLPPPGGPGTVFTVSGKREAVAEVVRRIQQLYDEAKQTKAMSVRVKRSQHRLVFGHRGSGVAEILAETGVSVEFPTDAASDEIVLRGKPEDLGRALSMVFERAERSVVEEIKAPKRFYKLLIGKRGTALNELREGYDKVRIDFGDSEDKIVVEGPPQEVMVVTERLKSRISDLEATVAMETIKIDPKYFRHIVGRQGQTIERLREHRVQVRLPERGGAEAGEIVIEGDPAGVEKAKIEIQQMVQRLENEKCKDVIIEPSLQQLLYSGFNGAPPPIRTIYDAFPKVSVVWPDAKTESMSSVVQLRGDRQQVDAAAERLQKLMKLVLEENYKQEIRIFKEFRPHIFGRGLAKIKKLLDETHTRIQYPTDTANDVFTIIGREADVQKAVQQIESLQKKMANMKEVIVRVPCALTSKFVSEAGGSQASTLRSIREQCDGVHMRFVNAPSQQSRKTAIHAEVVVLGPAEEVDKAQQLLEQLNARVAQLCAEEMVHADPKLHGFLIGRQGATITRFRERHNVELVFPDRNEPDAQLAREIRIVGPKEAVAGAKLELENLIQSIEDEVERTVPVDKGILRDLSHYRRSFAYPELDQVRVVMPKAAKPATPESPDRVHITVIGQKACVETAVQVLESIVADIGNQTQREFPLTDPGHFAALDRARSQFPELERANRVFIRLVRSAEPKQNHSANGEQNAAPARLGTLILTGTSDRIDFVYEDRIKPLLPMEEEFAVPQEFHRSLIFVPTNGQEKRGAQPNTKTAKPKRATQQEPEAKPASTETAALSKAAQLRQKYGVYIRLPPQGTANANHVYLRGTASQLAACKPELEQWLAECEQLRADRLARSYEHSLAVPSRHVSSLLAMRPKLTAKHEVGLRVLLGQSVEQPDGQEPVTTVVFRGYKERVDAAVEEVQAALQKWANYVTENLCIPAIVHAQLIGSRGSAIQRVMQEHKVRIEFPNRRSQRPSQKEQQQEEEDKEQAAEDEDTVYVTGEPENVDRACDWLIAKANDLVARIDAETRSSRPRQFVEEILPPDTLKA